MREEINKKIDRLTLILNKDDPYYKTGKNYCELQRESDLDAVNSIEDRRKRLGRKILS